jgi:NADP-dependent 3-hydroxy acid dehydrogenase YdfG
MDATIVTRLPDRQFGACGAERRRCRPAWAAETHREIEAAGGRALAIRCDVTDRAAVREAVARCERELGPTVRLVANAGGGNPTDSVHFDAGHIAAMVELNLLSAANCIEAVLPGMLARTGGDESLAATAACPGRRATRPRRRPHR